MHYEPITPQNRELVNRFIIEHWFSTEMILRRRIVDMTTVDGIVAMEGGKILGLVTYIFHEDICEITSLDSLLENKGIGTTLLESAVSAARRRNCAKVVLITTNDNLHAMRFYQRRGFDMSGFFRNALDTSRRLKPEIPLTGEEGIPLRHEIEFEFIL